MPSFLANIFETISSIVTAILVSVGLVVSPALPVEDMPILTTEPEVVVEKIVEQPVTKPITQPVIKPAAQPKAEIKQEPPQLPKTFTTPSGAVVDEFGSIIKLPDPTPTTVVVPTATLQITSVNITPTVPSALIEWQTNQPTISKIFISVPNALPIIVSSASGLSTRHIASIATSPGRTYSIEIEAITNDGKVAKSSKQFQTSSAASLTFEFAPNKDTAFIGGYAEEKIILNAHLVNHQGEPAFNEIGFVTIGSETSQFTFDKNGDFVKSIVPTQAGSYIAKLSVPAYNFEKSLAYTVKTYIKFDSSIYDAVDKRQVIKQEQPEQVITLGEFKLSDADESFYIDKIDYEIDGVPASEKHINFSLSPCNSIGNFSSCRATSYVGVPYRIQSTSLSELKNIIGTHILTIKEIKIVGIKSGLYRTISGLPVAFTFEVKDIPQPEFIPIKTSYTYCIGAYPCDVGVIGSFKIKMLPNSSVKLLCNDLQLVTNGGSYIEPPFIYAEFPAGREPQCPTSWFGGESKIREVDTDTDGFSKFQYSLFIPNGMPLSKSSKMEFTIKNLKVKDMKTGLVRDVLNAPAFELIIE